MTASDFPSFPSIQQKLSIGFGAIQAAGQGLHQAELALADLRSRLDASLSCDRAMTIAELVTPHHRLRDAAASGDSGGINLLVLAEGDAMAFSIGSALMRNQAGEITLRPVEVDRSRTALFDAARPEGARRGLLDGGAARSGLAIVDLDAGRLCASGDKGYIAEALQHVEVTLTGLKAAVSHLSIARSRLDLQSSFIAALCSASPDHPLSVDGGIADTAALRRTALETKRLLSEQGQSIASLNRDTVLRLFRDA